MVTKTSNQPPKPAPQSKGSAIGLPPRALSKSFEPAQFESEIYQFWMENECFKSYDEPAPGQKSFSMVIPPPNVTGVLHMGHALTNTIQDILVRWRRMSGDNALWLPGTDHAGIATQAQVEKAIAKEGKGPTGKPQTRHDLGREKFVARTWKWKEDHGKQITNQLKRLGSSLDWSRERFTMDEGLSAAVREVFVKLYEEDLIYRGERIINWCPRCQTALSDLEVIPTDRKGHFWHLIYKIVDDNGQPVLNQTGDQAGQPAQLVIATTRPETLLGDTAVAIHPEDERYAAYRGKKAVLPLLGRLIPVIQDSYVDREFGSGALKITPAHDFNDYEIGKRHHLPLVSVMGKDGRMTEESGPYAGLKFAEAREKIIQDLKDAGLLVKVEDHAHKVGLCQRCETVAEPVISKQWFVKIEPLAKPAIEAVETGKIQFTPKSWEKTYFEWMYNIRDWCISRQLWWGHQIPAWYCGKCSEITVARQDPKECSHCQAPAAELTRDEDVLDTWFSSALWPFSTLGWPEKTQALKTFYPTSILETGFDIIFFWVARMIMMGIHFMGEVPFHQVYLHAMVRDEKGEKMSKSKGNVIDPLGVIDQHGADPLRFTLAIMAGQGRDIKLSIDRVEGYRAFCNKLWNATKFFHLQFDPAFSGEGSQEPIQAPEEGTSQWLQNRRAELLPQNLWILSRLQQVIQTVESSLAAFELNVGAQALYDFTWHEFCDWYIELAKLPLKEGGAARTETLFTLHEVLETLFRLMHPFMPFMTEELWSSLPWKKPAKNVNRHQHQKPDLYTLMLQPYPKVNPRLMDRDAEATVKAIQSVIEAIRNFRGENNVSPKTEFVVHYLPTVAAANAFIRLHAPQIQALARVTAFERIPTSSPSPSGGLEGPVAVIPLTHPPMELRIQLKGLVNVEEEEKRLKKEIEKLVADLSHVQKKLSQETFLAKAPAELVEKQRQKEREILGKKAELEAAIQNLSRMKVET